METKPEVKKWYHSKIVIFNIVSGLVAVAGALQTADAGLDPKVASVFSSIVTAGNIVLRIFFTDTAIGKTKEESK